MSFSNLHVHTHVHMHLSTCTHTTYAHAPLAQKCNVSTSLEFKKIVMSLERRLSGSGVTIPGCPSSGPEFSSQHPHLLNPVPGNQMPNSGHYRCQSYISVMHRQANRQNTHTHKSTLFKKIFGHIRILTYWHTFPPGKRVSGRKGLWLSGWPAGTSVDDGHCCLNRLSSHHSLQVSSTIPWGWTLDLRSGASWLSSKHRGVSLISCVRMWCGSFHKMMNETRKQKLKQIHSPLNCFLIR